MSMRNDNRENMKKIILILIMLFSFIGLAASLDEYRVGYDEITATVDRTWRSQKTRSHSLRNKYTIVWYDCDGELCQGGSFVNRNGYREGDEVIIKVDKAKHKYLYEPTSKMVLFGSVFVITLLITAKSVKKEKHTGKGEE